jgi:hypothetical protein
VGVRRRSGDRDLRRLTSGAALTAFIGALGCAVDRPAHTLAALEATHARLEERLDKALVKDPMVAAAFADTGQVVVTMRARLIEELFRAVAREYLDNVVLDLEDVNAHSSGEIRKDTFLGRVKIGEWDVLVDLEQMLGTLRVGTPTVALRPPDFLDIVLPVDVLESKGAATLRFRWDSKGVANAVCRDFEVTQRITGRVLGQTHQLKGALRLTSDGEAVMATPVFPDRRVRLRMDLSRESWAAIESALRAQNTFERCGMALKPDDVLQRLKAMAAQGIAVKLPRSVLRTVRLPASLRESVQLRNGEVSLALRALKLRVENATLWSSAEVQVRAKR